MTDAGEIKYRAFLSYSHADVGTAKRVHARLEAFRIDKDLVGRATSMGPIPQSLRPIFRDRSDFDAGGALGEQSLEALDASAALIVLASRQAAKSRYVNEEARLFRSRHPERPVIPVIAGGKPGDPKNECFPAAVRFGVTPDGGVTETPSDVLAADLRRKGDGFDLAIAKVAARLIGLPPDEVYRRAERERQRQSRLRAAIAASIFVLLVAAGALFSLSRQQATTIGEQTATIGEIQAKVQKLLAWIDTALASGAKQSPTAQEAPADPRYAKALDLLKANKKAEAEPLLKGVAEDRAKSDDKEAAAAAYRNLANAVADPMQMDKYYAEAARLERSVVEGAFPTGWFQQDGGSLSAALRQGDILRERGDFDGAGRAYEKLFELQPSGRDGSVLWNRIGDMLFARGYIGDAMSSYSEAIHYIRALAESDPGNAGWQRDLAVALSKHGDADVAWGEDALSNGLRHYRDSVAIFDRLAKADPTNVGRLHDLSASLGKLGSAFAKAGQPDKAREAFLAGRAILTMLKAQHPDEGQWKQDAAWFDHQLGKLGGR